MMQLALVITNTLRHVPVICCSQITTASMPTLRLHKSDAVNTAQPTVLKL